MTKKSKRDEVAKNSCCNECVDCCNECAECAECKDCCAELKQAYEELDAKYLRAVADYQNLEKRSHAEISKARTQTAKETIMRFIDVLDDLENAASFVEDDGLKMIRERLISIFDDIGVAEIDIVGKEFDPHVAEAVEIVPPTKEDKDSTVIEVIRKGYKLDDEVIRPAQVKVASENAGVN